jgi:hypothetical protein
MHPICPYAMGMPLARARLISRGLLERFPSGRAALLEGNYAWALRRISDGRVQTHFV